MAEKQVTDIELEVLLRQSAQPALPRGFAERLQAKLEQSTASNVVAFPSRKPPPAKPAAVWLSAIPLAASLAIGLYLGAQGTFPNSFSSLDTALVSDATDMVFDIGIEDTESFINGELS